MECCFPCLTFPSVYSRNLVIQVWPSKDDPFVLPTGNWKYKHPQYGIRLNREHWVDYRQWPLKGAFANFLEKVLANPRIKEAWRDKESEESILIGESGSDHKEVYAGLARLTGIGHDQIRYLYQGISPRVEDDKIEEEIATECRVTIRYNTSQKIYRKFNSTAKHHFLKIRLHLDEAEEK